ncbi:MAG: transglutaminase-like domain-containing protein [Spirochaetaceae bacterium]
MKDKVKDQVKETALKLTKNQKTTEKKLEALFYYVRDEIKFGFCKEGDFITPEETLNRKVGQCNNKSTLFLYMCKAVDIEAKIHFSNIKREIQKGLFTGFIYKLMPREISHSWLEVKVKDRWIKIDSFINDIFFYNAGKKKLSEKGWTTGYSVSCDSGESSAGFNLETEKFVQMDAVTEDLGLWDNPWDFYKTDKYNNKVNVIKSLIYKISLKKINGRVEKLRSSS